MKPKGKSNVSSIPLVRSGHLVLQQKVRPGLTTHLSNGGHLVLQSDEEFVSSIVLRSMVNIGHLHLRLLQKSMRMHMHANTNTQYTTQCTLACSVGPLWA